jgi:hypothetical protein
MAKKPAILSILIVSIVLLFFAAGCGGGINSFKDVPIHPQAKPLDTSAFLNNTMILPPWTIMNGKVLGGPFEGYTIDGQDYYHFTTATPNPSIKDFYASKLSGWSETDSKATDEFTGISFNSYYWVKGDSALAVFETPDMFTVLFLKK